MRKFALQVLLLAALLAGCAASSGGQTSFQLPPDVQVAFNVLAPEGTAADAGVVLRLTDEVTGFGQNPTDYEMEANGERSYSLTLSAPAGTVLHYLYLRQGEGLLPEAASGGAAIAYRLHILDGAGHVAHDAVAAWSDDPLLQPNGRISGTVTDGNGQPLAGILVSASGQQTITDGAGLYALSGLMEGLHNLVALSPDGTYRSFQQGALVAEAKDTRADIQLQPNVLVAVTLVVEPPEDNVPAVPLRMVGNLPQFAEAGPMNVFPDGRYWAQLELPVGTDIRYKYTLGDGFWNAEHDTDGGFLVRQLILDVGDSVEIRERIHSWAADSGEAIWFDAATPGAAQAYLQFRLLDWGPALQMWPLGDGHFAYKLFSPTNFSAPLEYRYCPDSACQRPEIGEEARFVSGALNGAQVHEDTVEGWEE